MADAEELNKVIARKADKAIELVETVLEAGAGRADKAIELIEAIPVANAKEIFRIKAASIHSRVFRPKEFFELRPQQNTRGCLGPNFLN